MSRFLTPLLVLALPTVPFLTGCGGGGAAVVHVPVPERWVNELITQIVIWIEDGTGIDVERGDVKIRSLGARKLPNGSAYISDFAVTVTYRGTEFSSSPKDVLCDADGIPDEEGNRRIKEAVEEIKRSIRAAR